MINDKFEQSLLKKIKNRKIAPKPKWIFVLKNYAIWGASFMFLIISSAAFSIIIYLLKNSDWGIYNQISNGLLEFILLTLPYFWLVFLAVSIFAIYYNIKHTKKGYRYSLLIIAVSVMAASAIFGALFFHAGLGSALDDIFGEKAPFYTKIFNRQIYFWSQPENGRLAGIVISAQNQDTFILLDLNKNEWIIYAKNAQIMPRADININKSIRIIGEKLSEKEFRAERILPVVSGRGFFKRQNKEHCDF
ncbi:hypothetical protein KAS41_00260 [Candidatus Parcubacteria bacterium]|nr:hypothetical protein [Candidatus Parcubacteria bacterium]